MDDLESFIGITPKKAAAPDDLESFIGIGADQPAQPTSFLNPSVGQRKRAPAGPGERSTLGGMVGAVTRGAGPYAIAAGLGAAAGAPAGGVGAIPGAAAGAAAYGLADMVADPITSGINKLLGTKIGMPSEAIQELFTRMGVDEPRTQAERVTMAASKALGGAAGSVSLGRSLAQQGMGQTAQGVGRVMAAAPGQQMVSGAVGGASSQIGSEMGADPLTQLVLGIAGGQAGAKLAGMKVDPRLQAPKLWPEGMQEAKQLGIPVMTSDVRQPKTFVGRMAQGLGEKIPVAGTGGMRADQYEQRQQAIRNVFEDLGSKASGGVADIMDDLAKKRSDTIGKYVKQKSDVLGAMDTAGALPVPNATKAIDDQIAKLRAMNSNSVDPVIAKLEDWKGALQGQNMTTVEQIRKLMGESFRDPGLAGVRTMGESALSGIYGPLKEDMRKFIMSNGKPRDVFKWEVANKRLAQNMAELEQGALASVLESGAATPEDVNKLLFSTKPSEVQRLHRNLTPEGRANARTAIIARAVEKAGGPESISPEKFLSEVQRLGAPIGVMFQGKDADTVNGLAKALKLTARSAQSAVTPSTGVQAVPFLAGGAMASLFGPVGGVAATAGLGGMARLYESPAVRDILLKLPKVRSGSPEEAALLKRLIAVQASVNEGQE